MHSNGRNQIVIKWTRVVENWTKGIKTLKWYFNVIDVKFEWQ